jgi:hypothetical protein
VGLFDTRKLMPLLLYQSLQLSFLQKGLGTLY